MELPDLKTLKKLADACRKAGIKNFKGFGFEFTLADDTPISAYKAKKTQSKPSHTQGDVETDSLSNEELLFWSTGVANSSSEQPQDTASE